MPNKSIQNAAIGGVIALAAMGMAFKYLGTQPVIRDIKSGWTA